MELAVPPRDRWAIRILLNFTNRNTGYSVLLLELNLDGFDLVLQICRLLDFLLSTSIGFLDSPRPL
jgi:hypothetical protein